MEKLKTTCPHCGSNEIQFINQPKIDINLIVCGNGHILATAPVYNYKDIINKIDDIKKELLNKLT